MERIHRTVDVSIEPTLEEVAIRFVQADAGEQSRMLDIMARDVSGWGDARWGMQCSMIAGGMTKRSRELILTLAAAIEEERKQAAA